MQESTVATAVFDTHKAVKTLTAAKITERQAEALVTVLSEITANLVTKQNRNSTSQMAELKADLTGQMAELTSRPYRPNG